MEIPEVYDVTAPGGAAKDTGLTAGEIVLIVFAVIICLAAIFAVILVLLLMIRKASASEPSMRATYVASNADGEVPISFSNKVYEDYINNYEGHVNDRELQPAGLTGSDGLQIQILTTVSATNQ